jgi:predicted metal-dependent phosphoesterase TrpH
VCAVIHAAGGIASVAHPGVTRRDEMLEAWAAEGLDAIEAHHSDHDAVTAQRYLQRASELGMQVTGGSDFHGDEATSHRTTRRIAGATLPAGAWETLRHYAGSRAQ